MAQAGGGVGQRRAARLSQAARNLAGERGARRWRPVGMSRGPAERAEEGDALEVRAENRTIAVAQDCEGEVPARMTLMHDHLSW